MKSRITMFTSCFNQGEYLSDAIESALSQTYTNFEYLLFDDGSTDNTWEIIQKYCKKDKRIIPYRNLRNYGVSECVNESFREMLGDVWVWCPADDVVYSNLIQVKADKAFASTAVIYSSYHKMDCAGHVYKEVIVPDRDADTFRKQVWFSRGIGMSGVWIPKSIIKFVGPFPDRRYSEDFWWMFKACVDGVDFLPAREVLFAKRIHENRISEKIGSDKLEEGVIKIRKEMTQYANS